MSAPQFQTRRPTGKPSWPLVVLAGIEGSGKTWSAAAASALPMFGHSYFLEVGEQMADEYGEIGNYNIIDHDGSERQVIQAARWAAEQPTEPGKPNLLIIDSATEIWQLAQDEQQAIANRRAIAKGKGSNRDATITMDQWNQAKDHMNDILMACRKFPGPVIMTARLDNVSVVEGGQPTGEKVWKIRAEKNLPYQAQVVMQAREPRQWTLTKIASRILQLPPSGSIPWPEFTLEELFIRMELDEHSQVQANTFVRPVANPTDDRQQVQEQAPEGAGELAPGDMPPIPENLIDVLRGAEEALDKDGIVALWKIANAHVKAGHAGARSALARIEGAGKRINKRIADGEAIAPVEDSGQLPEPEAAANPKDQEGTPSSAPEQDAETNSPEPTSTPSETSNEDSPAPAEDGTPDDPKPDTASGSTENEPPTQFPDAQFGTNKDSGQPIHDPAKCKDSRRRKGILAGIAAETNATDYVFEQIGLEVEETSTEALQELLNTLTTHQKAG